MTEQRPTFVDPASRRRAVPLQFPIAYGGRVYHTIFIGRPTTAEVAAWGESLSAEDPAERKALKLYVDETGVDIPAVVMDGLDPDDDEEVWKAARDFLPRKLRAALFPEPKPDDSIPATGDTIAP